MLKSSGPKSSNTFVCISCDYYTSKKSQYDRHLATSKHQNVEESTEYQHLSTEINKKSSTQYKCECGKKYKERTGLWRHKKICTINDNTNNTNKTNDIISEQQFNFITPELIMELIKDNKEMKQIILEQNNTINNLVKNGITNTNNNNTNTNTNCMNNNKTFNLQFFLNETCKDAMNIMDFVDSIKLQLSDLEKVGEVGYTQGISNIITTNLKSLDVTQRPVHCTDKKRETMYIKDEDKWEKEDDNKTKLRKVIKRVANKNIKLLPQFRENNPEYNNSSSKISDKYDKMVIEAMGGYGNDDIEKEDKIIHNISKCTTIEKYSEV